MINNFLWGAKQSFAPLVTIKIHCDLKHSPATSQKYDPAGSMLPDRIATELLATNLESVQDVVMLTVGQR